MKIQHLAVIFILIIMPISFIFSEYISNQVEAGKIEIDYNSKLLNATYDAMKSYQINTITNSVGDRSNSKIDDLESAVNVFFNSLVSSFGYTGYKATVMEEYIPAVAFTLYDGYYIYQPYENTLTGLDDDNYDSLYSKDAETRNGVKSYVYYNQRYTYESNDFVITYTLDNYITIEGYFGSEYVYKSGFLVSDIEKIDDNTYKYDGIEFSSSVTEEMKEFIGSTEYSYVKIDGTKFYLDGSDIFYLDSAGNHQIQVNKTKSPEVYDLYYYAITKNKSAYTYYKNAYEFTNWVQNNLDDLKSSDASNVEEIASVDIKEYTDVGKIFSNGISGIESADSPFNQHRSEVIRRVVETNLTTAITSFNGGYILPKLSEIDWELIENNVCLITFMQGLSIGSKVYNNYSVVPNTLTKEHVDENDIYILSLNNTYCKANDKIFTNYGSTMIREFSDISSYAGRLKIDFEQKTLRSDSNIRYYPIRDYLASYTSVVGNLSVANVSVYNDMYGYMKSLDSEEYKTLKEIYYGSLARERMSVYNVNNGLKKEDNEQVAIKNGKTYYMPQSIDNWFYLKEYKDNVEDLTIWNENKGQKISAVMDNFYSSNKTIDKVVDELVKAGILTENEKDKILGNEEKGIEATGKITIDGKTYEFYDTSILYESSLYVYNDSAKYYLVLVYTDRGDIAYKYNGNVMLDVSDSGYTLNGKKYKKVYGYITENQFTNETGVSKDDFEVVDGNSVKVKKVTYDYDTNSTGVLDINDYSFCNGVFGGYKYYFSDDFINNSNGIYKILKCDIDKNKKVEKKDVEEILEYLESNDLW